MHFGPASRYYFRRGLLVTSAVLLARSHCEATDPRRKLERMGSGCTPRDLDKFVQRLIFPCLDPQQGGKYSSTVPYAKKDLCRHHSSSYCTLTPADPNADLMPPAPPGLMEISSIAKSPSLGWKTMNTESTDGPRLLKHTKG
jgi:hypothetical protein